MHFSSYYPSILAEARANLTPTDNLVYLVLVGSHSQNLNTANSDLDVKGIYIPSIVDLLLGKDQKVKAFKKDDVDYSLYSIPRLFGTLLKGSFDTFSVLNVNNSCIIHNVFEQLDALRELTICSELYKSTSGYIEGLLSNVPPDPKEASKKLCHAYRISYVIEQIYTQGTFDIFTPDPIAKLLKQVKQGTILEEIPPSFQFYKPCPDWIKPLDQEKLKQIALGVYN